MTKLPDDFGVQPSFAELQKAAMDPTRLTAEFAAMLEALAAFFRHAVEEERGAAAVRSRKSRRADRRRNGDQTMTTLADAVKHLIAMKIFAPEAALAKANEIIFATKRRGLT